MNSRQSHIVVAAAIIIAICAVFTAFNTFALVATAAEQKGEEAAKAQVSEQDEIVQVIGRVDGLGAESGFLVTDGTRFKLVAYNPGSMASTFTLCVSKIPMLLKPPWPAWRRDSGTCYAE